MRIVDSQKREGETLDLMIKSYITDSKPISSTYLCQHYNLPYSSATVRNVMEMLERKGLLCHLHTSSGRIPTRQAFRWYVDLLEDQDWEEELKLELKEERVNQEEIIDYILDVFTQYIGYTSIFALSGPNQRLICKGVRFILEQPEFEDVLRLKSLLYTLEVKIDKLQEVLFRGIGDKKVNILIGEDIGCEGIADCSLVFSGSHENNLSFALGLLGPVRMDYAKTAASVYSMTRKIEGVIRGVYEE